MTPKAQFKQLALGTILAVLSMGMLWLTSHLESQFVFYGLVACLVASILYAVPGYLGVWLWRMRDTLFKNNDHQKDS